MVQEVGTEQMIAVIARSAVLTTASTRAGRA